MAMGVTCRPESRPFCRMDHCSLACMGLLLCVVLRAGAHCQLVAAVAPEVPPRHHRRQERPPTMVDAFLLVN